LLRLAEGAFQGGAAAAGQGQIPEERSDEQPPTPMHGKEEVVVVGIKSASGKVRKGQSFACHL
jgi:hypothetical protein